MRPKFYDTWMREIEGYCQKNGFDYDKAKRLAKCGSQDFFALQHFDPEKGKAGLLDETPSILVLVGTNENGVKTFRQTEYTRRFLA